MVAQQDRRNAIECVRRVILENLRHHGAASKGKNALEERMQYGVIACCVPHRIWQHGHHTRPELPLMCMGLSPQKNDMVVSMLCLFENEPKRDWFSDAWKATGKKLHIEVGGMGCCVRFTSSTTNRNVRSWSFDASSTSFPTLSLT